MENYFLNLDWTWEHSPSRESWRVQNEGRTEWEGPHKLSLSLSSDSSSRAFPPENLNFCLWQNCNLSLPLKPSALSATTTSPRFVPVLLLLTQSPPATPEELFILRADLMEWKTEALVFLRMLVCRDTPEAFTQISHLIPNSFGILFKRTRGALPMFPRKLGRMLGGLVLSERRQKNHQAQSTPCLLWDTVTFEGPDTHNAFS